MTSTAGILSIGDELTLGQSLDTNSAWLSRELGGRGIITREHRTLDDDQERIASALRELAERCELVIATGGLGPTDDDLTRLALRDLIRPDEAMVEDEAAVEHLRDWFERRGRPMPAINRRQAERPASAAMLPNPHGTALGLRAELGPKLIFCLPGPPREMQPMFRDHVAPELVRRSEGEAIITAQINAFGLGESDAAERLGEIMLRENEPLVGITVSDGVVSARIRAVGTGAMREKVDAMAAAVEERWQPYAFSRGEVPLAEAVGDLLAARQLIVCTAESCTGGWLGKLLVDRSGSSICYAGGWITYSNAMKRTCLDVSKEALEHMGAVSVDVARMMAAGALRCAQHDVMGPHLSLSITGIAGPDGGSPEKPVGTVFIGLGRRATDAPSAHIQTQVRRFNFSGDRIQVRHRSALAALQMLRLELISESTTTPLLWEQTLTGEGVADDSPREWIDHDPAEAGA